VKQNSAGTVATAPPTTLEKFHAVLAAIAASPDPPGPPADLLALRDVLAARLASQNFLSDILTDVDGVSLHRFQVLTWTVILGVAFLIVVYTSGAMPKFNALILALLGISAGTYLGFKVPEQPS
jgi:hypothetical protein